MYPPDPTGRRPSQLSELQYANPRDRAADQTRIPAQQQDMRRPRQRDHGYQANSNQNTETGRYAMGAVQTSFPQIEYTAPLYGSNFQTNPISSSDTTGQEHGAGSFGVPHANLRTTAQQRQSTIHKSDFPTASEEREDQKPRRRSKSKKSSEWYCSQPGCPYRGPYSKELYANCALGCHAPRNKDYD